jgi:hypothetical protein
MGSSRFTRQHGPVLVANAEVNAAGVGFTTDEFDMSGYNKFRVDVVHTWVAATAVTFHIEHSVDGGTTWFRVQSGSVAAGTDTCSNYVVSKAVTATTNYSRRLDSDFSLVRLVFDSVGGTTDTTTVYITKSASEA